MKGNPLRGASYFLRGAKMLTLPGLRRFILIPLAVNVILFWICVMNPILSLG